MTPVSLQRLTPRYALAQPPVIANRAATPAPPTARSQLFARKSIDKLIAASEDPAHRLKKTLGPWSLTALGIGAIIGSGIFVLTRPAAARGAFEGRPVPHRHLLSP